MYAMILEPTNRCNRDCLHCMRNKADPVDDIPLKTVERIFSQAKSLGLQSICLTGGEVATYPHLEGLFRMIADYGFKFNLVTNGYRFGERLLPLVSDPQVRRFFAGACFSLDGATPETHDALRGKGSFKEVTEAANLCVLKNIQVDFKSAITNFNKHQLNELGLLAAALGAKSHGFIYLSPTPRLIEEGVIPTPEELNSLVQRIMGGLAQSLKTRIEIEGFFPKGVIFSCGNITQSINVDQQGNLILCCNLSHVTQGNGIPTRLGGEFLGSLEKISLKEGIIRHFKAVARLMEARLKDMDRISGLTGNPCYWCFKHFGKLAWLKEFPDSPWAAGVLSE